MLVLCFLVAKISTRVVRLRTAHGAPALVFLNLFPNGFHVIGDGCRIEIVFHVVLAHLPQEIAVVERLSVWFFAKGR